MIFDQFNPAFVTVKPEPLFGYVSAVRGYAEAIGDGIFVGPRVDLRYDVRAVGPEGRTIEYLNLPSIVLAYPRTPWVIAHPLEHPIWGTRLGNRACFKFDEWAWTGQCPSTTVAATDPANVTGQGVSA